MIYIYISPTVLGNICYVVKFADVYSRFSALYFLKNKTSASVLESFMKFEGDLAMPFDRRAQYLRPDRRNESTNRVIKESCKRTGVVQ